MSAYVFPWLLRLDIGAVGALTVFAGVARGVLVVAVELERSRLSGDREETSASDLAAATSFAASLKCESQNKVLY